MISQETSRNLYESLKDIRIKEIKELVENPVLTKEDAALSKIIARMIKENAHEVFIQLPDDKSVSCINIRDILLATNSESLKSSSVKVTIPSLTENDSIGNAARIMSLYRLRSLPVINSNSQEVIGQISSKRILNYIYDAFLNKKIKDQAMMSASDIMTQGLIIIEPTGKLDAAKITMMKESIDHLPVAETQADGKTVLKGVVTSNRLIQTLIPNGTGEGEGSQDIASETEIIRWADRKNILIVKPDDTFISTIESLLNANSTYAIVQSFDGVPLGIITYRDIISVLGEQTQSEIPIYIMGMPDDSTEAELVKSKFHNIVEHLSKISPQIQEARCKIKIKDREGGRRRYEVSANIYTAHRLYSYSSSNKWDLAPIFDEMIEGLKNQIGDVKTEHQKESLRYSGGGYN
jgi:CBS domain-containing protein